MSTNKKQRPKKQPSPFCIRLTKTERVVLQSAAKGAGMSLGGFLRAAALLEARIIREQQ